jgi:hypothetical protein
VGNVEAAKMNEDTHSDTWSVADRDYAEAQMRANKVLCEAERRRCVGLPEAAPKIDGSEIHRLYVEAGAYYQQLMEEIENGEAEEWGRYWATIRERYRRLWLRRRESAARLDAIRNETLQDARVCAHYWRSMYASKVGRDQPALPWELGQGVQRGCVPGACGDEPVRGAGDDDDGKGKSGTRTGDGAGGKNERKRKRGSKRGGVPKAAAAIVAVGG